MADGITFTVWPDAETASLRLFMRALDNIDRLIRDVDYAVTRNRTMRRWVVSALHSSAPTITLNTLLGDTITIDAIGHGLQIITGGTTEPPDHFTEDALSDLMRMQRLFVGRDRARSIVVSVNDSEAATLSDDIEDKTQRILAGGFWNIGSLEGSLEAINLHGTPTFTIWDRVSTAPVRCSFPRTMTDRVKQLLERRVLVRGAIRYFVNGKPRSITDIEYIEDATPDADLPQATFGSIPDSAAADNPTEFLRSMRGDDGR